jgi:hypothetical protein
MPGSRGEHGRVAAGHPAAGDFDRCARVPRRGTAPVAPTRGGVTKQSVDWWLKNVRHYSLVIPIDAIGRRSWTRPPFCCIVVATMTIPLRSSDRWIAVRAAPAEATGHWREAASAGRDASGAGVPEGPAQASRRPARGSLSAGISHGKQWGYVPELTVVRRRRPDALVVCPGLGPRAGPGQAGDPANAFSAGCLFPECRNDS